MARFFMAAPPRQKRSVVRSRLVKIAARTAAKRDHTSEFAFVQLVESAGKMEAARFLRALTLAVPCEVHSVPTNHGIRFTNRTGDQYAFVHIFDRICAAALSGGSAIAHRG